MENKISYAEKLKDPKWQKKRLEILNRDNFTCQSCGSTTKTLHVHHKFYTRNGNPWDASDFALITLCEDCHETITEVVPEYEEKIIVNYRLKINNIFMMGCVADVFESYDNLAELFFLLWRLRAEPRIIQLLKTVEQIKSEGEIEALEKCDKLYSEPSTENHNG